ncbi:MAG: hypothetical protein U1E66_13715 [Rhodospirillales bacterium]
MANTWAERTLCQYEDLGRADRSIQARFGDVAKDLPTGEREKLRSEQRSWLARREDCRTAPQPVNCLASAYAKRLAELDRRDARADLLRRPPSATDVEPFETEARRIERLTVSLRKRTAEDTGGTAFLWSDGTQPVMLVEPTNERFEASAGGTRYYFRKGALFYVKSQADRAGFEDGEMLFWVNAAGQPASGAAVAWSVRQQQLLSRAAGLLALFGER